MVKSSRNKRSAELVIDGKGHLAGRLAAIVAKELLEGRRVAVLRCEDLNISGKLFRNKLKFMEFLRKKSNTNPRKHSHIHYRTPSKMFWRIVRGMCNHKTGRGQAAIDRLRVAEGVPEKYITSRRMTVPAAQTHVRIATDMPVTRLGDLASQVGWKRDAVVKKLEAKRKETARTNFEKTVSARKEREAKKEQLLKNAPQDIKDALALIGMCA